MKTRAQRYVLSVAAVLCFLDSFLAPKSSDPGALATAVTGVLLVRRAIIVTPQPTVVISAGCTLTALMIVGNHGLVNINRPIWIAVILIAFVGYGLWERVEKLWR